MDIAYWTLADPLALFYAYAGTLKLLRDPERLRPMMAWVDRVPRPAPRALGAAELFGAAGLLLPPLTGTGRLARPGRRERAAPAATGRDTGPPDRRGPADRPQPRPARRRGRLPRAVALSNRQVACRGRAGDGPGQSGAGRGHREPDQERDGERWRINELEGPPEVATVRIAVNGNEEVSSP